MCVCVCMYLGVCDRVYVSIVGTISLFICLVVMVKERITAVGNSKGLTQWGAYVRIVLFLVVFLYLYALIFAARITEERGRDELGNAEHNYLVNLILGGKNCSTVLEDLGHNWGLHMGMRFDGGGFTPVRCSPAAAARCFSPAVFVSLFSVRLAVVTLTLLWWFPVVLCSLATSCALIARSHSQSCDYCSLSVCQ
jgi:hypothetical protein